jgi:exopolysaccharide production protein ExoY
MLPPRKLPPFATSRKAGDARTQVDLTGAFVCSLTAGHAPTRRGPAAYGPFLEFSQGERRPPGGGDPLPRWKRLMDLACCVVALPFFCILALGMVIVLGLTSPGPIFYTQERVGFAGRRFKIYKFRTMFMGSDPKAHQAHLESVVTADAPMVKLDAKGDSRLVPCGRMLRATGLDEVPQIINVIRREMSIVGPRPCLPYEFKNFQPWQRERFKAMPGLTGLWQVSGKNRTTFNEMTGLDSRYVRERSFSADLLIILKTVPALLAQVREARRARASRRRQALLALSDQDGSAYSEAAQ